MSRTGAAHGTAKNSEDQNRTAAGAANRKRRAADGRYSVLLYGHVTDRMKREGADKMEDFIRRVSGD